MKKFKTGQIYQTNFVCDSNCILIYKVIKRTEKTVTIKELNYMGRTKTCKINQKISEMFGEETIWPDGRYSMAPILHA